MWRLELWGMEGKGVRGVEEIERYRGSDLGCTFTRVYCFLGSLWCLEFDLDLLRMNFALTFFVYISNWLSNLSFIPWLGSPVSVKLSSALWTLN